MRKSPRRCILIVLAAVACAATLQAGENNASDAYVRVVEQDAGGVSLRIDVPRSAIRFAKDDQGFRTVSVEGLNAERIGGYPALPVIVTSLAVPEGAALSVDLEPGATQRFDGPPMRRTRRPSLEPRFADLSETEFSRGMWPAEPISVEQVRFRGLNLARLRIYPLRYEAETRQLILHRRLDVRVDFRGGLGFAPPDGGALGPVEARAAQDWLANGATLLAGRPTVMERRRDLDMPVLDAAAAPNARAGAGNPGVKLRVDDEGLVRVTGAELEALGLDRSVVDPGSLRVSHRNSVIPCRVTGESDGVFDAADAIEFYGTPNPGLFSRENVYWIDENPAGALRFPAVDGTPAGGVVPTSFLHRDRYEEGNSVFTYGNAPNVVEGEPHYFWVWFEDNPNPPRVTTFSHVGQVVDLDPTGAMASFRASFIGRTSTAADPDHKVRFFVNGTQIGETTWDGQVFHLADVVFDPSLLVDGANTFRMDYVSVTVPDIYYLDWFEIEYPRLTQVNGDRVTVSDSGANTNFQVSGLGSVVDPVVLDVTNPLAPEAVTGFSIGGSGPYMLSFEPGRAGSFLVVGDNGRIAPVGLELDTPSDLRNTANGADLIIIVPEGWESAIAPLVAHRQAQGLRVVVANLTDIADEFAGGNVDDVAVRDFIEYAYGSWQGPPVSYVILVGEANRDPQNWLGQSPFYFFMPTHSGVTDSLGLTTTDTWFGAVSGEDLLPDVAVGRFSVRSQSAAAALASKIMDYENNPPAGAAWGRNVLHIASDEQVFEFALESAAQYLPAHFTVDAQYRRLGATSSSIQGAFDSGAVVASFLGHGNVSLWADSGTSFFTNAHVNGLANAGRLPFVTALNCINGFIAHPTVIDSMSEVFVNRALDGAVANWSPSSLGFLDEYDWLQQELYESIFVDRVAQPGLAVTNALVRTYLTQPVDIDLVKKMIFLGDPSGWLMIDSDDDQLPDRDEVLNGLDPGDRDTDDDGLLDGLEGGAGLDTDGDGSPNALDPDSDNDALPDGLESGVETPGADTNTARGVFRADLDPLTTTDPFSADTDGGGAPDGVEDLDSNGRVDGGETDPLSGFDDPACAAGAPPEIAVLGPEQVRLGAAGGDLVLTWGDVSAITPCVLYRVYLADGQNPPTAAADFKLVAVTASPTYTHLAARFDGIRHDYLIVGATLSGGEGPWGHFE